MHNVTVDIDFYEGGRPKDHFFFLGLSRENVKRMREVNQDVARRGLVLSFIAHAQGSSQRVSTNVVSTLRPHTFDNPGH